MPDQWLTDTKLWLTKRRSKRIPWNVSVVVHRSPKEGPPFYERTETLIVNAHGALMPLAVMVAPMQKLLMQNIESKEQQECRVVSVEKDPTRIMKKVLLSVSTGILFIIL